MTRRRKMIISLNEAVKKVREEKMDNMYLFDEMVKLVRAHAEEIERSAKEKREREDEEKFIYGKHYEEREEE